MSIINNILKDLENKRPSFTPIEVAAANGPMPSISRTNLFWPVLIVLTLLLGYGVWSKTEVLKFSSTINDYSFSPVDNSEPLAAQLPLDVSPIIVQQEDPVAIVETSANKIIGLQIKESDSIFSLEFVLQSQVVAYLKERNENSFILHLKKVESEILAPTLSNNQWISRLNIVEVDEGVDIEFYTRDQVLVGTTQYLEGDQSVWSIALEKVATVSSQDPKKIIEGSSESSPQPVAIQKNVEAVVEEAVDSNGSITASTGVKEVSSPKGKPAVKLEISSTRQSTSSLELQRATELVRKKRWKQAEAVLLELLGLSEDLEARELLLRTYENSSQSQKLDKLLRESLLCYPDHSNFNMIQGRVLFAQGQYQSTIELLVPVASGHADQLALIGASYQRIDNYELAIEYYRSSLTLESRQARNWINLGLSLEHNGELGKALEAYRAAIKLGNLSQRLLAFVNKRSRTLEKVIK